MMTNISIISFIVIIVVLTAVFFILKTFSLPASFFKNQSQRAEILKRKMKAEEEDKIVQHLKEVFDKEEQEPDTKS